MAKCAWCEKATKKLVGVRVAGKLFMVCPACADEKKKQRY
jgi:ribosome-binding protein aMBF1 (putative translation factor)